ncbi:MAG: ligase-associated DNA damage response endonuclease PdeM [Alphaproteobacteria bacterium]
MDRAVTPRIPLTEPAHGAIAFCGAQLMLLPDGAVWWPEQSCLIVADLHFDKGSAFAAQGALLPPWDTRATLDRLAALITLLRPRSVICLGDSFHDDGAVARLPATDRAVLTGLAGQTDWVWVAGNHDPAPAGLDRMGGRLSEEVRLGPLTLRHEPRPGEVRPPAGTIWGHFHPKGSIALAHRRLTGRCFVFAEGLMILPAFGAFTGGLDVRDPALERYFPQGYQARLAARDRLLPVGRDDFLVPRQVAFARRQTSAGRGGLKRRPDPDPA